MPPKALACLSSLFLPCVHPLSRSSSSASQGDLEEAEALLRRAAEMAASSLGPMHAATANALSNLGVALRKVWRGLRAGVRVHGTSAYDGVGAPRRQGANRLRSCKDLAYPVTSSQTACGDLC